MFLPSKLNITFPIGGGTKFTFNNCVEKENDVGMELLKYDIQAALEYCSSDCYFLFSFLCWTSYRTTCA